ncbi:MAG: aromatic ring-hydroxylating dioxygenase subunit alpha [Alphaproteobacteria bacterium]|nr:aromatic ring-hydroxylating dioxygenase subunit alpha [Alphaproteobacteria bacterium]
MTSREQNETVTRTGPGTPGGALLRRYWQPVALSDELDGPRPLRPVRVLGEDLVLFRDEQGRLGLVQRACPHRRADLAFGRLEDGGLRCPFHGWLFDAAGKCRETPAEPEGSRLCERVRMTAYPAVERRGIVWGYLGADEAPAFPDFDCFVAPESHVFAFKGLIDCNWLQALEVGIDPAHASYLHRFFEDEDPAGVYGRQFRANSADSEIPMTRLLREHGRPAIRVENTEFGLRLYAQRQLDARRSHLRVTNLVFPQAFVIPMSPEMTITQWHVPVDDTSNYWYALFTSFTKPVDKPAMRAQRLELYELPDYRPRKHRGNDWGYDAEEQAKRTYTGMGFDINVHDQWAVESQGAIHDRSQEQLGTSDKAIGLARQLLLRMIAANAAGERPLMVLDAAAAARLQGPATVDGIAPNDGLEAYWREFDRKRRQAAPWHSAAAAE